MRKPSLGARLAARALVPARLGAGGPLGPAAFVAEAYSPRVARPRRGA